MIEMDMSNSENTFTYTLHKIKCNPYTTIHIANLQSANPAMIALFRQSIEKGFLQLNDQNIDLRHSIIIYEW